MKDALALALVHFVWQGALLAGVGWILMRLSKVPSIRYAIGVATMLAMLAAPAVTLLTTWSARPAIDAALSYLEFEPASAQAAAGAAVTEDDITGDALQAVIVPTTWILNLWALGVCVLSLRFAGGLAVAHRLATAAVAPVGDDLQRLAADLALRLKVRGLVQVRQSASVAVPVMIGWLRPVVVLPPAALATLPLDQLEALLAHELAHIRRHDYLINLLQTLVETVCFYHPAVWWMSREVRLLREECCDDVAVSVCDRLTYVTALSTLASLSTPRFALAATGGSLRDRVRRLVHPPSHSVSAKGGWMAMLPILLVLSFAAPQTARTPVVVEQVRPAVPVVKIVKPVLQDVKPVAIHVTDAKAKPLTVKVVPSQEVKPGAVAVTAATVEIMVAPRVDATQASDERQRTERAVAAVQRERELRNQIAAIEAQLATLKLRLDRETTALERQRELAEKGLVSRESFETAQARVTETTRRLEEAQALSRERTGRETERLVDETRQRYELATRGVATREAVARAQQAERTVEGRRRELEARGLAVGGELTRVDPETPVQPQDRLTIVVAGEPDLPTTFTVRSDGSIRFPFLGVIRVQGSTALQVQSVIQKLIADKGLAKDPQVTVSIGRSVVRRVR